MGDMAVTGTATDLGGEPVRRRALTDAWETSGLMREAVRDLEINAADIDDQSFDQLVEQTRIAIIDMGLRLVALRRAERVEWQPR